MSARQQTAAVYDAAGKPIYLKVYTGTLDGDIRYPLAHSVRDITLTTSLSRSEIYQEIASGALTATEARGRTLVFHSSSMTWLITLPDFISSGSTLGVEATYRGCRVAMTCPHKRERLWGSVGRG